MATSTEAATIVAKATGLHRPTVLQFTHRLIAAGLIRKGPHGRHARHLDHLELARLLIALAAVDRPVQAVDAARAFGQLVMHGQPVMHPEGPRLPSLVRLEDAVAACLDVRARTASLHVYRDTVDAQLFFSVDCSRHFVDKATLRAGMLDPGADIEGDPVLRAAWVSHLDRSKQFAGRISTIRIVHGYIFDEIGEGMERTERAWGLRRDDTAGEIVP